MSPIRKLADTSRQLPLRNISKLILDIREEGNFSNDRDKKTFITLLFETNSFL